MYFFFLKCLKFSQTIFQGARLQTNVKVPKSYQIQSCFTKLLPNFAPSKG